MTDAPTRPTADVHERSRDDATAEDAAAAGRLPGTCRAPAEDSRRLPRGAVLYLAGYFVLMSALAFLFPPNGDDWSWGSSLGIARLDSWFKDYNGRYAGDLLVLGLVRTPWLTPFVIGAVMTAIVYLVTRLARTSTYLSLTVVGALVLSLPVVMWNQSVAWTSGFSNYSTAAIVLLGFLLSLQREWTAREAFGSRLAMRCLCVVILGIIGQLFIENVTIYVVLASISFTIAVLLRQRRVTLVGCSWIVASIVGAVIMFSNGAYGRAAGNNPNYQSVHVSLTVHGIKKLIVRAADPISGVAVVPNTVLNIVLAGLVCAVVARRLARGGRFWAVLAWAGSAVFLGICLTLPMVTAQQHVSRHVHSLGGVAAAALAVALLIVCARFVADPGRRAVVLVSMVSIVLLSAPFLVASPFGPRCFFVDYVLFMVIAIALVGELTSDDAPGTAADASRPAAARAVSPRAYSGLAAFLSVAAVGLFAFHFVIYGAIAHAWNQRLTEVREAAATGQTQVTVHGIPFKEWVHVADPYGGTVWEAHYKQFYGIRQSLTIHLVPAKGSIR